MALGQSIDVRIRDGGSFRDPAGFVYTSSDVLYRQVNKSGAAGYDALMRSGLYERLVREHLLVPHEEMSLGLALMPGAYRILRPERVPFISYPYEWCTSQLRDAALATLAIQTVALEHGLTLKDGSAYNIQFKRGKPILIDTLSFDEYVDGSPWIAYRQFCQHFVVPLLLMTGVDVRMGNLLREYVDGIPLDLGSRLLPFRSWLRFGSLAHVHLHARALRRFARSRPRPALAMRTVSQSGMLGLLDSLRTVVERVRPRDEATEWSDYASRHNYSATALDDKAAFVDEWLLRFEPSTVWDLGANTGRFSRRAAGTHATVIAFDADESAVESNYRDVKSSGEAYILPLRLDLSNPSPALGWAHCERKSLIERGPADLVLALALVHHLAIGNNVPLSDIAQFFSRIGHRLVIEFVPKADSQVQFLLSSREDVFCGYTEAEFERAFRRFFRIVATHRLQGSERVLYAMEREA